MAKTKNRKQNRPGGGQGDVRSSAYKHRGRFPGLRWGGGLGWRVEKVEYEYVILPEKKERGHHMALCSGGNHWVVAGACFGSGQETELVTGAKTYILHDMALRDSFRIVTSMSDDLCEGGAGGRSLVLLSTPLSLI